MEESSNHRAALGRLVIGASRSWRRVIDRELAPMGLSEAVALPLLTLLRSRTPLRQCDIARALHLERPALVRIMDLLVKSGLVQRQPDPRDKRSRKLALTARGRRQALGADHAMKRVRDALLMDVNSDDLQRTLQTLGTVELRLLEMVRDGGMK